MISYNSSCPRPFRSLEEFQGGAWRWWRALLIGLYQCVVPETCLQFSARYGLKFFSLSLVFVWGFSSLMVLGCNLAQALDSLNKKGGDYGYVVPLLSGFSKG